MNLQAHLEDRLHRDCSPYAGMNLANCGRLRGRRDCSPVCGDESLKTRTQNGFGILFPPYAGMNLVMLAGAWGLAHCSPYAGMNLAETIQGWCRDDCSPVCGDESSDSGTTKYDLELFPRMRG